MRHTSASNHHHTVRGRAAVPPNRRRHARLRLDRSVRIPVQISPVLPFLGESLFATLLNLSGGGVALFFEDDPASNQMKRGCKLRIHLRLPGAPLWECRGVVSRRLKTSKGHFLGIRFTHRPAGLIHHIEQMALENDRCDDRIDEKHPWCDANCAYLSLCRKSIRLTPTDAAIDELEIALQTSR